MAKLLKRTKSGGFEKWLGKNIQGTNQLFRMPAEISQSEAEVRWSNIETLWDSNKMLRGFRMVNPDSTVTDSEFWDEKFLKLAKSIGSGKTAVLDRDDFDSPSAYVKRFTQIQDLLTVKLLPGDPKAFELGLKELGKTVATVKQQFSKATGKPDVSLTGTTFGEALEAYAKTIAEKPQYRTQAGGISAWAKTQLDNVSSIRKYYLESYLSLDLGELKASVCESIIEVFTARPNTCHGKPLELSSAMNFVTTIRAFFKWLNKTDDFEWDMPIKFDVRANLTYRQHDIFEKEVQRQKREHFNISREHLKILAEYGTPIERLYFFLALNCAFGSDQLGRLQTTWIDLTYGRIDGERLKAETLSRHELWEICVEGLKWYLDEFPRKKGLLFLTDKGDAVYHNTASGNVLDGFSRRWSDLIRRIRKDLPDFPKYSFGKIRKTAATEILRLAGPDTASMLLAHKTISADELLRRYANYNWDKLFAAQRQLGIELKEVFLAAGPAPFQPRPKTYIGLYKDNQIIELWNSGNSARQIAKILDVSRSTVYKHLNINAIEKNIPDF